MSVSFIPLRVPPQSAFKCPTIALFSSVPFPFAIAEPSSVVCPCVAASVPAI